MQNIAPIVNILLKCYLLMVINNSNIEIMMHKMLTIEKSKMRDTQHEKEYTQLRVHLAIVHTFHNSPR